MAKTTGKISQVYRYIRPHTHTYTYTYTHIVVVGMTLV